MKRKINYLPLLFIFIIMIYSLMNNYQAKFLNDIYTNNFVKQLIFFIVGITLFICIQKIKVNKILKHHYILYFLNLILLILVLFFGKNVNGAKAWFDLKVISLQPSEFMKITLSLSLAQIVSEFNKKNDKFEVLLILKISLLTLLPSILVFIEPDTGAVLFYFIIFLTAFLSAKVHKFWKILFAFIIIMFCVILTLIYIYNPDTLTYLFGYKVLYRIDRFTSIKNNYQINNAMILMGSTNFFGSNKAILLNLPEAPTDFIFAFNFFNYGLFGFFILTITYLFLSLNLVYILKKSKNNLFQKMFTFIFLFGTLYNILMNLGLLPIMGITLPFFSYGGSSLITSFLFLSLYYKEM